MKRVFANISYHSDLPHHVRQAEGIIEYMRAIHPTRLFYIDDRGDLYVLGELSEEDENTMFKQVVQTGVRTYKSMRKEI